MAYELPRDKDVMLQRLKKRFDAMTWEDWEAKFAEYACPPIKDEDPLQKLSKSGKRLRELLNITKEDTDRVLKEIRDEWE